MSNTVTIAGLADRLGVSRMTIHRMRKARELPDVIKTTRRIVRWNSCDIELWLELDCPNATEFKALKRTRRKFSRK